RDISIEYFSSSEQQNIDWIIIVANQYTYKTKTNNNNNKKYELGVLFLVIIYNASKSAEWYRSAPFNLSTSGINQLQDTCVAFNAVNESIIVFGHNASHSYLLEYTPLSNSWGYSFGTIPSGLYFFFLSSKGG
ncbi:hypothetical protein RFI_18789, partial [Reticulomyxa filosa]